MSGDQVRKARPALSSSVSLKAEKPVVSEQDLSNASAKIEVKPLNQNMPKGNDNKIGDARASLSAQLPSGNMASPLSNDDEAETILQLGDTREKHTALRSGLYNTTRLCGIIASILWVFYAAVYTLQAGISVDPTALGGAITSIFAPVALFWLCFTQVMRGKDVQYYAESLRSELEGLLFPSKTHAYKVNKDIQLLCQQVADMNNHSRAALKSIQRARHGLRSEIRDFSSIAGKAEFHIDRLGDGLEARKAKLLTALEDIKATEETMKAHADAGISSWKDAESQLVKASDAAQIRLAQGSNNILKAADKAQEKVDAIEARMDNTYQSMQGAVDSFALRLDDMSGDFDGQVTALSEAADRVSEETNKLGAHIRSEVKSLENMTIEAISAMGESSSSIDQQRQDFTAGISNLAEEAHLLASRLEGATENMEDTISAAQTTSADIEGRLSAQADRIGDLSFTLDEKASMIEKSGEHIAAQLGDSMEVAVSGAEKLRGVVRKISEEMHKAHKDTHNVSANLMSDITKRFQFVHDKTAISVSHLHKLTGAFSGVLKRLDDTVQGADKRIVVASNAIDKKRADLEASLTIIADQISDNVGGFDAPIAEIRDAGQELELRQEQITKMLETRTHELNDASDNAKETAKDIGETLTKQVQTLSALGGELSAHSTGIEDQMRIQREQLTEHIHEICERIDQHKLDVDGHLEGLTVNNSAIDSNIARFTERMSGYNEAITKHSDKSGKNLKALEDIYFAHWNKVESHGTKSANSILKSVEILKGVSEDTVPYYDEIIEKVDHAQSRFNLLNDDFVTISGNTLDRLDVLRNRIDDASQELDDTALRSGETLCKHEEALRNSSILLEDVSSVANKRLKEVESRFKDQESNVQLLADKMELRIDNLNETMGQQFIGLTQSVGQAVTQLSNAASRFEMISNKVNDNADQSVNAISRANEKTLVNLEKLLNAGKDCVDQGDMAAQDLARKTSSLLTSTQDSRDAIAKAGDSFIIRAREFEEMIKASLSTTKEYVLELKTQANEVVEASSDGADQIRVSISDISGQMDHISKSAKDVSKKISESGAVLGEEADKLNIRARSASSLSEQAAKDLARQSNNLFKAVRDAQGELDRMSELRNESQQEHFIESAKYIVESLHSLSVDISRQFGNGDVDDKTWKAFKKGDVSVFTRRLANLVENVPLEKLKAKYQSDNSFRTYVIRFIRQFEELNEQASKTAHADMINASFMSSDVGKLYLSLRMISEGGNTKRAA